MTHAEEIALVKKYHREDLGVLFDRINPMAESVVRIEEQMGQVVKRADLSALIRKETTEQFKTHFIECKNDRLTAAADAKADAETPKRDWFGVGKNALFLAGVSGGITTGIISLFGS